VEAERDQILHEACMAAEHLVAAQQKTDSARGKVTANPSLTVLLLSEADRATSDALACLERIQRCLTVCKGKAINGRWPNVANKQRDDAAQAAQSAARLLVEAQETIGRATHKVQSNPNLSELVIIDVARMQARALVMAERIARLMTEATIGRE
jgi:predicted transposase YbfD/YdcC